MSNVASRDAPPGSSVRHLVSRGLAERAWRASITGLVLALTAFVSSYTVADPDLWGHVRFGLDAWRSGSLPATDAYSYLAAGHAWINHEWLAEVLMGAAWARLGAAGLVTLKLAVVLATVLVIWRHLRWRGLSPLAAAIVVVAGWWLMLPWLTAFRPQVFTYLGCACVLALVSRAQEGRYGLLWWAVPLLALWANLHGGFLAGLGLLAVWALSYTAVTAADYGWRSPTTRTVAIRTLLPLAAAALATVATPYGTSLWTFLRTALEPRLEIAEWNPVSVMSIEGVAHAVLLLPAVAGWLLSRRPKPFPITAVFLCAIAAPFVARRHTPLLALAVMMLAGEHLADAASAMLARRARGTRDADAPGPVERPWLPTVAFALAALVFALASIPHFARIVVRPWEFPVAPVRWLAAHRATGEMITFFDWGEYVIWHLAPGIRVSMDGRRETVYPDEIYREDQRLLYGVGTWDALLRRGQPDLALMSRDFAADNLLRLAPGWRVAFEDERCTLFVRTGSPHERQLLEATIPRIPDDAVLSFP
jgi:hypothetical protein